MTAKTKSVLVIGGPTATGKSRLALELAKAYKGTLINGDSIQLYKELSVLSARPRDEDLNAAPHDLYGVLEGNESSSVASWRTVALKAIYKSLEEQRFPIIVGGTGLYLKALCEGLSIIPSIPKDYRVVLSQKLAEEGLEALYQQLMDKDPEMAKRLKPQDQQRILRALEVLEGTGTSLLEWQKNQELPPSDLEFIEVILLPDRAQLNKIAEERFERMLQEGAIEEVKQLLALGYEASCPVMKAIGVREIQAYLQKEINWEGLIEKGKAATRQYIKRQFTWFNSKKSTEGSQLRQSSASGVHVVSSTLRSDFQRPIEKIILKDFYHERTFPTLKKRLESTSAWKRGLL